MNTLQVLGFPGRRQGGSTGSQSGASVASRLARGTAWSLIGTVTSQALGFASSIFCARFLGKEGFGAFGMVQNTIGMFGTFAGLGLGITTTRYVAQFRSAHPERTGRIIGLATAVAAVSGGLLALALLIFAPLLAAQAVHAPRFAFELRIGACLLLLNTLNGPQTAVLSGLEAFKTIALVNSIRGMISLPLIIGGLLIGRIQGALWGLVVAACVGWLLNQLAIRRECRRNRVTIRYHGASSEWRALWSFSIPAFLQSAMVAPVSWVAASFLVSQSGGFAELGLFNAANQLRTLLMFLPQILSGVALPILTSLFTNASRANGKEMDLYHLFNQAIAWPMVAAILLSSRWILRLYGPEFRGGEMAMLLVVGTAGVCVIGQTMGTILWAKGKVWFGLAANTIWALILLLIVWRTVPAMGAIGLALAYLVAYVFLLLIQAIYLNMKGIVTADFALRNVCSALGIVLLLTTGTPWVQALPHSLGAIAALTCASLAALYFGVGREMRDTVTAFLLGAKPLDKPGIY